MDRHSPNPYDIESELNPDLIRIDAREYVTSEQVANGQRLHGWKLFLAWAVFAALGIGAWYGIIWCGLKGAKIL